MGIVVVTQEGMALYSLREWANCQYDKGNKLVEPLVRCYWCLPSLHSLAGYAFAVGLGLIKAFSWKLVLIYPLCVSGSSVLNGMVWGILSLIMNINQYYEGLDMNNFQEPNDERIIDDEPKESYFIKRV